MNGIQYLDGSRSFHQSTLMALQSMYDQVRVSYMSREYDKLFPACEIIMLSCQNKSLSAMFRRETRSIELVHWVMNHALTFALNDDVLLQEGQAFYLACNMQPSRFLQGSSFST